MPQARASRLRLWNRDIVGFSSVEPPDGAQYGADATVRQRRKHVRRKRKTVGKAAVRAAAPADVAKMTQTPDDPRPPSVLSIAGSDSGGGAGIQADLLTFADHGVHGLTAITAITAQNTRAVTAVQVLPAAMIEAQVDALFDDFRIAAVKLGMLADATVID